MAILDIKIYPNRVLRKKAIPVKRIGREERAFIRDMIETMRHADGVGLAAPQVGVSKRIIVVEDIKNNKEATVLINPKIVKKKGKSRFCEGCLSIPGVTSEVTRAKSTMIEALNSDGETLKIDANGLFARIVQHEIDHLDGILFIDRIGFLKRKKIVKRISPKACMEL